MTVFILTGFILTISEATARVKQVVVCNGETVTKGSGWTNSTATCAIKSQTVEAHSGKSAVEFKFKGSGDWLGCGWNWAAFQVGEYGTDISAMKNFTFWLKVKGTVADFSVFIANALQHGKKAFPVVRQCHRIDMLAEHHTIALVQ